MKNWTSMLISLVLTAALCFGAAAGMAEGVLTLPSAVKEIQVEAFAGAEGFAEIILPEGVEKIGERAFAESSIERIRIPDGVTDIGTGAFYNCVDLVSADVSDGVTEITDYLFWRCLKLEQVDIPAGVTRIGEHAFSACIALPEIEIPNGVTEIGEYAFSECAALTRVTVPGSVKSIGQMAFYSCLDLETVVLKDGVESIANNAFFYCPYLTRVEIPASVTSIGMSAFGDCDELMIYGETGSYAQTYAMEHGIPFISEAEAAYEYVVVNGGAKVTGYTGSDVNVVIPETLGGYPVTAMERTFDSSRTVETVVLPSTLKTLGGYTFWGCESLRSVTFNSEITAIGEFEFFQCRVLEDFMLPESVTSIGMKAFSGCHALTKLPFSGHVQTIGNYAFEEGWGFVSLDIPDGVKTIGTSAFADGQYMKKVVIPASVTSIGANAFSGSIYEMNIYGYAGTAAETYAAENGFAFVVLDAGEDPGAADYTYTIADGEATITGYTGVSTTARIPATIDGCPVTTIAKFAFKDSAVESVVIPDGVTTLEDGAFIYAQSLREVAMPASVTSIGPDTFFRAHCDLTFTGEAGSYAQAFALERGIAFVDAATGETLFDNDFGYTVEGGEATLTVYTGNAQALVIPAAIDGYPVAHLADGTLQQCETLMNVTFEAQIDKLGVAAFMGCDELRAVYLPESLTEIGLIAFKDCAQLNRVDIPKSVTVIDSSAFEGCPVVMIFGYAGSYAQTYAGENGITFIELEEPEIGETPASSFNYTISDGEATILQFIGSETQVVVPAKIEDCPVTRVNSGAFYGAAVTSVVFPESVWEIGEYCFSLCDNLESVTITAATETIGANILNECPKALIIGVENSYAHLYAQRWNIPFTANGSLPARTSDYYLTTDGTEATVLFYTGSMTDLVILEVIDGYTITGIGNYAFTDVNGLTKVTLPSTLKVIGKHAFSYTGLQEIEIPDGVFNIGPNAFRECYSLTKATIPASVTNITSSAFRDCGDGFTIYGYTGSAAEKYATEENYLFVALDGGENPDDPETEETPAESFEYTIADGEVKITGFTGSETDVVMPKAIEGYPVTTIGNSAFTGSNVRSIVLQSSVNTLEGFNFTWCAQMETVTIPASVTNIGDCPFLQSNSDLIIIGEAGSAAEAAAQKYAVDFKDAATGDLTYNDDYGYEIANGQATVTAYSGTETVLMVPSELGGCPVTAIGSYALMNDSDVTSITIPEGVMSIGVCAMQYNYSLTEVILPESLTRIGAYTFRECESLKEITIPKGVTRIGENAFDTVAADFTIKGYADSYAQTYATENNIPFIALDGENPDEPQDPEGEQTEGSYTYTVTGGKAAIVGYAGSDMEVTIPAALGGYPVVKIGEYAFEAKAMTAVIIPDSVTTIESAAFYWCRSLQAVSIPANVTSIGTNAFSNAHTDLIFTGVRDSAAQTYAWENAIGFADAQTGTVLFDNDFAYTLENGVATLTLYTGDDSELVVPAEYDGYPVGALRWGVLQQSDTLTKVTFEAQVPSIPHGAFLNCDLLVEVRLPDSVTSIASSAFKWCYALRDVHIPASVTSIDATAFDECPSTLTIHGAAGSYAQTYAAENGILFEAVEAEEPEYTYSISYDFMAVITGYTGDDNKLVLPSELGGYPVGYIGDYAFEKRTTLLEVTLPATLKRIGTGAFSGCTSLWDVVIPQGVTEICDSAFYGCTGMTGTELPDSVTSIGGFAYYGCSHLKKAIIPESVTSIGARAFHECAETFAIHGYAGSEAQTYAQANGHRFVELDSEVDTTGFVYDIEYSEAKITDYNGSETGTLHIPSELEGYPVTSVGRGAFYGCQAERIVVPECMSKLWSYSFAGCENLTDINIPASVTAIGECAFLGCSSELIVTGTSGSAIEAYAKKYGVGFKDAATGEVLFDNDYGYEIVNGEATIYAYTGLESELTLPNTLEGCPVTALGDCALKNNERLTSVVIPAGVKTIGAEVLQYCYNLTHVEIPEGVERIGAYAFVGMDSLMDVTVPASVTEIGLGAFTEAAAGFTMYGYTSSAAQTYAGENDIPFVALDGGETDETLTEGKYTYTVEEGKATVVAYAGGDVKAVIPQTLGGYPVTAISAHAFEGDTVLMDVTIPEGVSAIGEYAFASCTALNGVHLPVSLESVGAHAFDGCSNLNFVEFEKNVTFVGEEAFVNCGEYIFFRAYPGTAPADYADAHGIFYEYNYDELYDGGYVYNVLYGEEAAVVGYTGSASDLVIPASLGGYPVTMIAPEAFQSRTDITSVVFPEGLTLIATNAFAYCENLSSVSFPSTLIEFYGSAFAGTALTDITLPQNMDSIGFYAFEGCKQLTKVTVLSRDVTFERLVFSNGNENLTIYGYTGSTTEAHAAAQGIAFAALDVLEKPDPSKPYEDGDYTYYYLSEENAATLYRYNGSAQDVVIPSTLGGYPVVQLSMHAFSRIDTLRSVTIPDGVKRIQMSAFLGCANLTSVSIPDSVTEIGGSVFSQCSSLTSVNLPSGLTAIGSSLFEGCSALESIDIPAGVVSIGDAAFYACNSLKSVDIPAGVVSIGSNAFANCWVLSNVTIPQGVTRIEDYAFYACDGLTETGIHENITYIGSHAFECSDGLQQVTLPENVTEVGDYAFYGCTQLTNVTVHNPEMVFGTDAFDYFYKLTIHGYTGSTAQTYASANGAAFVALDAAAVPVVQFANAQVVAAENLAFELFVNAENWTTSAPLAVSMTTTDANLDIINTKFTSASQTLMQLGQSGAIYATATGSGGSYSNTTDIPNSTSRTFYIQAGASSTPLYISGNYKKGNTAGRSVTLTLLAPADGSYSVGANSSCTIIYNDVDASMPTDRSMTKAQWMAASKTWLEAKYPSGRNWNHLIGAVNAVDNITAGACHDDIHVSGTHAIRSTSWDDGAYNITLGARICNGYTPWPSAQCMGFALKAASDVFGSDPKTGSGWTTYSSYSAAGGLQAGDYVRVPNHSFFVLAVDASGVSTVECNASDLGKCIIFRKTRPNTAAQGEGTIEEICRYNWTTAATPTPTPVVTTPPPSAVEADFDYFCDGYTVTIDGYNGSSANVVIPATIEGCPVTEVSSYAFQSNTTIRSIVIPDSVELIGDACFEGCSALASVTLGSGLQTIGANAFGACDSLTQINLPEGLGEIGEGAFVGTGLTKITVPASVYQLSAHAFRHNYAMTEATIKGDVGYLGDYTFIGNMNLKKVVIEGSVSMIGESTFAGCTALEEITIPDTVTKIANSAFDQAAEKFTIYGYVGSYAHTYAMDNGHTFKALSTNITPTPKPEVTPTPTPVVSYNSNGYLYILEGENAVIVSYYGGETKLVIPDELGGHPVTAIKERAFKGTAVTEITLPESLTSIGAYVFEDCSQLYRVKVLSKTVAFDDMTFGGTSSNLTILCYSDSTALEHALEMGIPYSILDGLDGEYTDGDWSWKIENGETTITKYTGTAQEIYLTEMIMGSPIVAIGVDAFRTNSSLEKIVMPDTVKTIGMYAFGYCDNLSSVTLPEGLVGIGQNAFRACYKLKEITIPDSVTSISSGAFQYCTGLTKVKLPSNLTSISANCFQRCRALTSIELPVSLTSIGNSAFYESGLTEIDIPGNVTSIGQEAFWDCTALKEIYIPDSVTEISYGFAKGCTALESVYLMDGVTTIGWYAFEGCTKLKSVRIPESVTSIGTGAFDNVHADFAISGYEDGYAQSYALENGFTFVALGRDETLYTDFVYWIEDGEVSIGSYTGSATRVVVPYAIEGYQVTAITASAFYQNTTVTSIDLPDSIRTIVGSTFSGCTNLEEVKMPSEMANIGDFAFDGCAKLKSITLPKGIQAITEGMFYECASLTEIVIPDGVLSIERNAFDGCASLADITLPDSVKYIGSWAFLNCADLKQVHLPDALQTVDECAFYATGLTSVDIPNGVTTIGNNAFTNCAELERIVIPASVTSIGTNVFFMSPKVTVYGYSESAMEAYAAENGIAFIPVDKGPVVQFADAQVVAAENLAFTLNVNATNWTENKPLAISMTTSDAGLDIINTKFTSASQTLVQLGQSGAIYETANHYSNTTDKPNSTNRTFYIQAGAVATPLYIAGNYKYDNNGVRSVTLKLLPSADGSYSVGENNTCTIIYNDVDVSMPTDRTGMTKAQWMAACKTWFESKYPSGRFWNHWVGAVNAVDNLTAGACHGDIHASEIHSTSWDDGAYDIRLGASICNGYTPWNSAQCMGFAMKAAFDAFGADVKTSGAWTGYSSYSAAGGLQAGDYVRVPNHSFFVLEVNTSGVMTVECNASDLGKCIIFRKTRPNSSVQGEGTIQEIYRYNW